MTTRPVFRDLATGKDYAGGFVRVVAFTANGNLPTDSDFFAECDTTAGSFSLTLPSPTGKAGYQGLVQKTVAVAGKLTLVRTGTEKIMGVASSYDLPNSNDAAIARWHLWTNGTDWFVG